MSYFKLSDSQQYDDTAIKADISALQTGKVDKVDGMSLIEDVEKERLSAVTNYDDTEIKTSLSALQTGKVDKTSLSTVATTGSYNDLTDKPETFDYTVFMQDTQPLQDGLWIKGEEKDFRFTHVLPQTNAFAKTLPDVTTPFSGDGCSVAIDGKIYIFADRKIYCFLPETYAFSELATINLSSVTPPSCAYADGKIYLFGFDDKSSSLTTYKAIYQFDLSTNECVKSSAELPMSLAGTSAVTIGDFIYIFGGSNDATPQDSILKFDPSSNTITKLTKTLPNAMSSTSAVTYDGKAYIFGGYNYKKDNYYSSILEFDPVKETIKQVSYLSEGRDCISATIVDNFAYLFGGMSNGVIKTISKFDCTTKEVINLDITLPYAEYNGASSAANGHSYIFSGVCGTTSIKTVVDFVDQKPLTFDGYYIYVDDTTGTPTKISAHEIQNVSQVTSGTNFDDTVKAYSVVDGMAIEL